MQCKLPTEGQLSAVLFISFVLVAFIIIFTLVIMGKDNGFWFESFFFIAIGLSFSFEILVDLLSITICDVFLPNMIYPAVMYAKRICEQHIARLCSLDYPLDYYDSFSSSRYLHTSHFYAEYIELSIEKVFVMSYVNPFPGRMSWSLHKASFSSPLGWILLSLCSMLPRSVLKFLVNVITSVIVLLVFILIASSGANYVIYCFAIAILLLPFLLPFCTISSKIEPEDNINDKPMTLQSSFSLPANDERENIPSISTTRTLGEAPVLAAGGTIQHTEGGILLIETDDAHLEQQHQGSEAVSSQLNHEDDCKAVDETPQKINEKTPRPPSPTFRIDIPNILTEDLDDHHKG